MELSDVLNLQANTYLKVLCDLGKKQHTSH